MKAMERIDYYIVVRDNKIKLFLPATVKNFERAQQSAHDNAAQLLQGTNILTEDDLEPEPNNDYFLILVNNQLKDKVMDYDEAKENIHTYKIALGALDVPGSVQLVQVKNNPKKRSLHFPFEGLDELTLKKFHVDRHQQANCEFCHPNYPAQPYQNFKFCPHCGRYLQQ